MIRRPPRSTQSRSSAASDVYKRQDTECAFTFTSGVNLTSIQYCVTANGNIVQIEIPEGVPLISAASLGEGYGVCDVTSGTAYTDYGGFGDSGNWRPATVLSH